MEPLTQSESTTGETRSLPERIVAALALPWVICLTLLAFLAAAGGLWNLVANTRLLNLMIEGGVVRFHDKQIGPIDGVPELKYFVASQDPIVWPLLLLALLLMVVFWSLKGLQMRYLVQKGGGDERAIDTFRLYFLSQARDRWLPMRAADQVIACELAASGASETTQATVIDNVRLMAVTELAFFSLVSLAFLGWTGWLEQAFWGIFIFAIAYWLTRPNSEWSMAIDYLGAVKRSFRVMTDKPLAFLGIFALSAAAFFSEHVAVYVLSQAFTSTHVIINIEFPVFLMAIVAGNIARLIPVTPGGLGQFEWAFAMAIYLSGTGMPEAVTMAVLFALLRYLGGALFGVLIGSQRIATRPFSEVAGNL
jgi:uncharacterized membrane protein YbhN (UPF0104 family)